MDDAKLEKVFYCFNHNVKCILDIHLGLSSGPEKRRQWEKQDSLQHETEFNRSGQIPPWLRSNTRKKHIRIQTLTYDHRNTHAYLEGV